MNTSWLFLTFLAVPIIVHLFNFRKAKKLYFSSIKFINTISSESKAKTRLKHYLVLVTRFGIFTSFLYLLFAFISSSEGTDGEGYFIYFDNSISQSIEQNNIAPLSEVKNIAKGLLPKSQYSTLLTNDFSSFSNNSRKSEEVLNELFTIDYSFYQAPINTVIDRIESAGYLKSLYFSDMQGLSTESFTLLSEDTTRRYSLIVSQLEDHRNVFVDTAYIKSNVDDFGSILLDLRIGVSNGFKEGNIVIKLLENGKQLSSVVKKIEELSHIEFDIPRGANDQYEVVLTGDDVEYDNSFFFAVGSTRMPTISLISSGRNDYLSKVFSNTELFEFYEMNINSIDFSKLNASDLIVINNLESIPNGIFNQLSESTFILFPADSVLYLDTSRSTGIGISKGSDSHLYRSTFDSQNTLFSGIFNSYKTSSSMPIGSALYSFQGVYESLMKLSNGQTFLAKSPDRNVYMFSCPLDEQFTDLPVHAMFLPMMYQLAMKSVNDVGFNICYYPNQLVSVESNLSEIPMKIASENFETFPEFSRSENDLVFRVPSATPPGFYYLIQDSDTLGHIAVNLARSESVMEGIGYNQLKDFFKDSRNVSVYQLEAGISAKDLLGETPSSLWKYVLLLMLLFILTETMLHRYFK